MKHGGLPTPYDFDFAARTPGQGAETVTIPTAEVGVYSILVYGVSGAVLSNTFTLTATSEGFAIRSVANDVGGNTGRVTVAIHGTRVTPTTQASLVAGSTIPAVAMAFQDASLVYATFDLTGQGLGTDDVRLDDGTSSATLPGGFSMVPGRAIAAGPTGNPVARPRQPPVRPGRGHLRERRQHRRDRPAPVAHGGQLAPST